MCIKKFFLLATGQNQAMIPRLGLSSEHTMKRNQLYNTYSNPSNVILLKWWTDFQDLLLVFLSSVFIIFLWLILW